MVDRLKQLTSQVTATSPPPHPFDPLSTTEIDTAVALVREKYGPLNFHAVSLYEPRKAEMLAWLADPEKAPRPARCADVIAIAPKGKVYDGIVNLDEKKIVEWKHTEGVQPIIVLEELQEVEHICRKDPRVIEQCEIIGIPREEMEKVYCDRKFCLSVDFDSSTQVVLQPGPSATMSGLGATSVCSRRSCTTDPTWTTLNTGIRSTFALSTMQRPRRSFTSMCPQ